MLIKSYAAAVFGVDAHYHYSEVNASGTVALGKINYFMVGLPDNAVKEGYQRIESAIKMKVSSFPRLKLVVNLARWYPERRLILWSSYCHRNTGCKTNQMDSSS